MPQQDLLNIGVIGTGRIGRVHAANIATRISRARLYGVSDIDLDAAQEVAAACSPVIVSNDYRKLLASPEIDAVLICSSTDTHAVMSIEAAQTGKHILCEKPIDLELERIDSVRRAVDAAGVKFQVGFNRRFDSSFSRVKSVIESGRIGTPQILRITSRDPAPPPIEYVKASGGLFLDMMIHDFDMARYLLSSEVTEVFAAGEVLVDPLIGEAGDIDTAVVTLRFENGAIGTIDNSRQAVYGYDQRVEVFGSDGMTGNSNHKPDEHLIVDRDGTHSSVPLHFFMQRYSESFVREVQAFVDAVLDGGNVPVDAVDGLQPVLIALAADRSLSENRPVRISEINKIPVGSPLIPPPLPHFPA